MSVASSIPENDDAGAFDRRRLHRSLPETAAQLKRIQSGAASMMELPAEAF